MEKNNRLDENAKDEWMKLVKKAKKKQKGLPALTKINTNAGNVEHNVAMFNKINSPIDGPSNNPISGPFGGDVTTSTAEGAAMGESLHEDITMNNEKIELNYKDIPVEVTVGGSRSGYFDRNFGNWLPDDGREETIYIDWTYKITKNDAIEVLQDSKEVEKDLMVDGMTDEEFVQKIIDNLDDLVEKYEDELLDYYLEAATEHAQENYLNESVKADNKKLDDSFDMSLRTLL